MYICFCVQKDTYTQVIFKERHPNYENELISSSSSFSWQNIIQASHPASIKEWQRHKFVCWVAAGRTSVQSLLSVFCFYFTAWTIDKHSHHVQMRMTPCWEKLPYTPVWKTVFFCAISSICTVVIYAQDGGRNNTNTWIIYYNPKQHTDGSFKTSGRMQVKS